MHFSLLLFLAGLAVGHAANIASSNWDDPSGGTLGWTISGDGSGPVRVASGGNPGGFLQTTDLGRTQGILWQAPSPFLGNVLGAYGGSLSFDLQQAFTTMPAVFSDVFVLATSVPQPSTLVLLLSSLIALGYLVTHRRRVGAAAALIASALPAATVYAPGGADAAEGNSNSALPFYASCAPCLPSQGGGRYQQVFSQSLFGASAEPLLITAIAFRLDAMVAESAASATYPDLEIRLSTTSATPATLSATFGANVGANEVLVYDGLLTLTAPASSGPLRPFALVITLQTPFLYLPSGGNLLLDIVNRDGSLPGTSMPALDATNAASTLGRVYQQAAQLGSASGTVQANWGLITRFEVATVPEPATLTSVGSLLAIAFLARRRRR
jgi:hypothetical protein